MPLTPEQFNRCSCECMVRLVSVHDSPQDLAHKAEIAIAAAEALTKAMSKVKRNVGPMDTRRVG